VVLNAPEPDTVYMFCYTSGTTGEPKAAIISHKNLVSNQCSQDYDDFMLLQENDVILSFLPYAHIYE